MWYFGDPCYVVDDWVAFWTKLKKNDWKDGEIEWCGQTIEIMSNGGDGVWRFEGLDTAYGNEFGVDAGIFCAMPMSVLDKTVEEIRERDLGMLFKQEPEVYVKNGIVFINDTPDSSAEECEGCNSVDDSGNFTWCNCGYAFCFGCDCTECEEA